jgi:transposase-like protein
MSNESSPAKSADKDNSENKAKTSSNLNDETMRDESPAEADGEKGGENSKRSSNTKSDEAMSDKDPASRADKEKGGKKSKKSSNNKSDEAVSDKGPAKADEENGEKAKTSSSKNNEPPKKRARTQKEYTCICTWPECADFQDKLPNGDLWKGYITLPLTSSSNKLSKLQDSVCRNLGIALEEPDTRNLNCWTVANHHWTRDLIAYQRSGKHWTKPLNFKQACHYLYKVSENDKDITIKDVRKPWEFETAYLKTPNVPKTVVRQYIELYLKSKSTPPETPDAGILDNRNEIIERLVKENKKLEAAKRKQKEQIVELNKQVKTLEKKAAVQGDTETVIPRATVLQFLESNVGLTRFAILSDEWHANNKDAANQLFGYRSWEETKEQIFAKFPELKDDCASPTIFKTRKGNMEMSTSTEFERCLCVKMMDRTGLTKGRIAFIFGRNPRLMSDWRKAWCPKWGIEQDGNLQNANKKHMNQATKLNDVLKKKKSDPEVATAKDMKMKESTANGSGGEEVSETLRDTMDVANNLRNMNRSTKYYAAI